MSQLNRQIPRFSLVMARKTGAGQNVNVGATVIPAYNTLDVDRIGEYNPATYTFTARKSGIYFVQASLTLIIPAGNNYAIFVLYVNGVARLAVESEHNAIVGACFAMATFTIMLNQNDVLQVRYANAISPGIHTIAANLSSYLAIKRLE